jgi:hypothetical protein
MGVYINLGQREGSVAIKITQPRAIQRRSYCEWRILDVCRTTDSLPVHFNFIRARDGSGGSRGFSEARTLFNSPLRLAAAAAPLSHISKHHTAFAIEGADRTITGLRQHSDLQRDTVVFGEGETTRTLPLHPFEGRLDLVLLDGPHAYALPQLDFVYLFPQVRAGG